MKQFLFPLFIFGFLIFSCKLNPVTTDQQQTGVIANNAMVVSAHPLATEIGRDILQQGGNAYDAAVAVQFALAVCYPRAGNIGGGGFLVARDANGNTSSLDFREKAPAAATTDMYLDSLGNAVSQWSRQGYLAVGVPGSVAGMVEIHAKKGSLPWEQLLQPAIDLAANGFALTKAEANKLNDYQQDFYDTNADQMPFLNDVNWQENDLVLLPKLAETLQRIQQNGKAGFYEGKTAKLIAEAMQNNGGIITEEDLKNYEAVWRKPIQDNYKEYNIISMPPPSSGGVALIQLLKGVEQFSSELEAHNSSQTIHLYTELQRRVYADRATHLGDADFYNVPVKRITSNEYLQDRYSTIDWFRATPSQEVKQGTAGAIESWETTHFSIIDQQGNAVAITTTLNGNYGSKAFVSEGGFFLNNEMDDFSAKPGVPNMFGLIGSEANKIEPGKRMLSSMTPTIIEKNGDLFMVVGTPGGSTIITSVFQTILNVIEFDMTMQEAVNAKKVHHQWLPDRILAEKGALSDATFYELGEMNHFEINEVDAIGRVDAILVLPDGRLEGAADPRGDDLALGY